jgi:hypothetical protein
LERALLARHEQFVRRAWSNYDVTAGGKRFLMIKDDDQDRTVFQ